jgi:cardiolipin synthase
MTGPAVEALAITFLEDWELETAEGVERLSLTGDVHKLSETGTSVVHVVPSGPIVRRAVIDRVLLTTIYEAREELILTSPYFVPDETLLVALVSAARRGVQVHLIVPQRIDSRLVKFASEAYHDELLAAGVKVHQFREGLLHTKSVTFDGKTSLFGSLNLDPRSLHLNFEITLLVHCPLFTARLRALQQQYMQGSDGLSREALEGRHFMYRLAINAARLLSPLL